MSWLDAHECFVMDVVVRDRMEDLRSTIDVATAPTEATVVISMVTRPIATACVSSWACAPFPRLYRAAGVPNANRAK